jgi:hypothetical protein
VATGDVLALTAGGRRRLLEVKQIVDTASRRVQAQAIDPEIFDLPLSRPRRLEPALPVALGPAHALVLDLPTLPGVSPTVLTWLAIFADPWPGALAVWRALDDASYTRVAVADAPAIVGTTLDDLPAGPTGRWDRANTVRVRVSGGTLTSLSDLAVLGGRNVAAVQNADGGWELLQFANAELVDSDTYVLSRLLRGQAGSEWAMAAPLAAGSPFVLLDRQLVALTRSLDDLGRPMSLRIVAANRDHGDPSALAIEVTPQATALMPLNPVHISAVRDGDGVHISWVRRTRTDGDSWDATDVPLGEASEGYAVDILSGSTVLRTLSVATPTALYAAADELADFGAPQTSLGVTVTQLSATIGRGFATAAVLTRLG